MIFSLKVIGRMQLPPYRQLIELRREYPVNSSVERVYDES
jgi:hypothetical protein